MYKILFSNLLFLDGKNTHWAADFLHKKDLHHRWYWDKAKSNLVSINGEKGGLTKCFLLELSAKNWRERKLSWLFRSVSKKLNKMKFPILLRQFTDYLRVLDLWGAEVLRFRILRSRFQIFRIYIHLVGWDR